MKLTIAEYGVFKYSNGKILPSEKTIWEYLPLLMQQRLAYSCFIITANQVNNVLSTSIL
jgi:hypothetical protein